MCVKPPRNNNGTFQGKYFNVYILNVKVTKYVYCIHFVYTIHSCIYTVVYYTLTQCTLYTMYFINKMCFLLFDEEYTYSKLKKIHILNNIIIQLTTFSAGHNNRLFGAQQSAFRRKHRPTLVNEGFSARKPPP